MMNLGLRVIMRKGSIIMSLLTKIKTTKKIKITRKWNKLNKWRDSMQSMQRRYSFSKELNFNIMSTKFMKVDHLMVENSTNKKMKRETNMVKKLTRMRNQMMTLFKSKQLKLYSFARLMMQTMVILNSQLTIHPCIKTPLILQTTLKTCLWSIGKDLAKYLKNLQCLEMADKFQEMLSKVHQVIAGFQDHLQFCQLIQICLKI